MRRHRITAGLLALLALVGLACGESDSPAEPEPEPEPEWALVWADEFDGTALDASKWEIQIGNGCDLGICGWGNDELQWYQADNITVADGRLSIEARRETVGIYNYSSSRIRTLNKGDWRYGRFEARMRLPVSQGYWPAFWMLPSDDAYGGWAASGEIDIMELVGNEPNVVHGTLHYGGTPPRNTFSGAPYRLGLGDFDDDFHVFAVEWEEGEIRWYVDDRLYQTQTSWYSEGGAFPAPFDQEFHLILNVAVGGNWPGDPDATSIFPQSMDVDWVRVYQRR